MKKRYTIPLGLLGLFAIGFAFGPKPDYRPFDGKLPELSLSLNELDDHIAQQEAQVKNLKPDNQARIIWADSIRKTEYSVVYLHGFSASAMEGRPVHQNFAERFGANLYLARLPEHGVDDKNSFKTLTPKKWIESAKEAIAIGKMLGDKLILMSCSTGSPLAIYISSQNPDLVHAQIMYSPNIALFDGTSKILTYPWGTQIGDQIFGGEYRTIEADPRYWTVEYHNNGVYAMMYLLEGTMQPDIFQQIDEPLMMGYYYENEEAQDEIVSVEAMKWMFSEISTPAEQKWDVAFPNVNSHVIASDIGSKDWQSVQQKTIEFAEEVLGMQAIEKIVVSDSLNIETVQ
ncbi:MAG: alpha/beta hydrolase [Saprospiraceae bacterium]